MRPISMVPAVALLSLSPYSVSPVWGQADAEQKRQAQALKLIRETAHGICYDIQQHGEQSDFHVEGEIHAKVSGVAAKIANLGIGGTAELLDSQYQGILRQQLAAAIKTSTDCRKDVFDKLYETMLRGPAASQQTQRWSPSPSIPTPGLLYDTGTGRGGFERWPLTPGWSRHNEMLLNDGTRSDKDFSPTIAPYRPASADYAVEAEIHVI